MSAWKRQAVPLVLTEVCVGAIKRESGASGRAVTRIFDRVDRWVEECWKPLRRYRINIRHVVDASSKIGDIIRETWPEPGNLDVLALLNALILVVDDTERQMPKSKRHPWTWLLAAIDDLAKLLDPERECEDSQAVGAVVGERIMSVMEAA